MHCKLVLLLYPLTMNKEIGHHYSKPLEVYSQPSVSVISLSHFGHAHFIIQSYSEKINIQNNDGKAKKPTLSSHSISSMSLHTLRLLQPF